MLLPLNPVTTAQSQQINKTKFVETEALTVQLCTFLHPKIDVHMSKHN